jgi:hypothetical protein
MYWQHLGQDIHIVPDGYLMREMDERLRPLEWLHQWFDMAVLANVLHLDMKPSNVYNNCLIDYDNLLFQLAGHPDWCCSDGVFYSEEHGTLVQNEVRNVLHMVGTESGFFVYVLSMFVYLVGCSRPGDESDFMEQIIGLPRDAIKNVRRPDIAASPLILMGMERVTLTRVECDDAQLKLLDPAILPNIFEDTLEVQREKSDRLWQRWQQLVS